MSEQVSERGTGALAFSAPRDERTQRFLAPGPSSAPAHAPSTTGMGLQLPLNDTLPPMRTLRLGEPVQREGDVVQQEGGGARLVQGIAKPCPSATVPHTHTKVEPSPPHPSSDSEPDLPMTRLLHTTSLEEVQAAIQEMRDVLNGFSSPDRIRVLSGHAISSVFNANEPNVRSRLWTDWGIYSSLCTSLGVPVYPIQPDKVAFVLATHSNLPIASVLRSLSKVREQISAGMVRGIFDTLNEAAKASRHLWPDVACFVRSADNYEVTNEVLLNLPSTSRPEPPARAPPVPALQDSFTSRPLLTQVPPAPPPPALVTPPPEQFFQRLETFDIAQKRFQQTVNTPAYAARAAHLHNTALIYTHITAVLEFPTYPITTAKLAVFALAMTPGPLGEILDSACLSLKSKRDCPRASGKQLESLLKDVTVVRMITRGGDDRIPDEEKSEWKRWWEEITDDWKGASKPANRRVEHPTAASDVSAASTSRLTSKKGRQPRSRIAGTDTSRASSPAFSRRGTPSASNRGGRRGGYGGAGSTRSQPVSPEPVYPRWIPRQKGVLPTDRREPELPPILDSPWYVPKKKKIKAEDDGTGSVDGKSVEGEESATDEEDEKKPQGRSVALNRPRRGGTDMQVFDISLLWT
ncbi:hypothetical protein RTG_02916 [Rhodotorula toruloides ATCC 204091]|uniref:Uncharacterized protein n=1 Tax=Rhodotorula toruloides TaxID=5286 RepID=A0A0K3CKU8_RHOTO|nr:hypothetical protein RTG_02916 [Rhodotorula toruloides ATCC 204091]